MGAPLLQVKNVGKSYRLGQTWVEALKSISLTVQSGEFFALAGSSGSGKTTLLNLIGAIDQPTTGEIFVDNIPLHALSANELALFRCKRLGFIFQTFNLIPTLTAKENVEYPLMLMGIGPSERGRMAVEALQQVGLSKQVGQRPAQLSGGQRQRVAIARAIVKRPKVILADEPTANLDKRTAVEILDLMESLNRDNHTTFIFSTHDPLILQRAGRVYHMAQGEEEKKPSNVYELRPVAA